MYRIFAVRRRLQLIINNIRAVIGNYQFYCAEESKSMTLNVSLYIHVILVGR